jgi:hypothetical protein
MQTGKGQTQWLADGFYKWMVTNEKLDQKDESDDCPFRFLCYLLKEVDENGTNNYFQRT